MKQGFLITSEAAKILKMTPAMVRYLERMGKLRAHKTPSGFRVFERTEVEKLAAERARRKRRGRDLQRYSQRLAK